MITRFLSRYFRYPDGVWPNVAALGVTLGGWPLAVALLAQPSWPLRAAGWALLVLSLTWSAYFIHEFTHGAIFRTAGAYGATMASTYNSRALVPEVLVDGDRYAVVADRVEPETLIAAERVPEWLRG